MNHLRFLFPLNIVAVWLLVISSGTSSVQEHPVVLKQTDHQIELENGRVQLVLC